jgi:hypothetical protein
MEIPVNTLPPDRAKGAYPRISLNGLIWRQQEQNGPLVLAPENAAPLIIPLLIDEP